MSMKPLIDSIEEKEMRIEELKASIRLDKDAMADFFCPIKVGDVLEVPREAYSHIGKQCRVICVVPVKRGKYWKWRIVVQVLKTNGDDSLHRADWTKEITEKEMGQA
jgi:hypothetical protein